MSEHKASYYINNLAMSSILCVIVAALMSLAAGHYEQLLAQKANQLGGIELSVSTDSEGQQGEDYYLDEQPCASPFFLAHNNYVPSAQSVSRLSKEVTSFNSIITHKDILTHNILSDHHITEILSVSHRPSAYYIFALNRMRD